MSLTAKQQKFVDEYLKCFNATEAARLAGYKATNGSLANIGWENVRKREIAEKIKQHFAASAMSRDENLARLAEQARGEHTKYLNSNGTFNLAQIIADGKAHLVKGTKWDRDGHLVIEFYDAHAALVDIGKVHGVFSDNIVIKLEQELNSMLDHLQSSLDSETYQKVLDVIASASQSGEA